MKRVSIALLALIAFSCKKKDVDTDPPVIVSSVFDATVQVGEVLNIQVLLRDNKQLKQLKIDIHDDFDGHGHRSFAPFSTVQIFDISGTEYTFNGAIQIPTNAASGPYHITLRAIDESGNQSTSVTHTTTVTNPGEQPVIAISAPDFSNPVTVTAGNTLSISGTVTDNTGIDAIDIKLEKSNSADAPLYDEDFSVSGIASWDFQSNGNVNITISSNANKGKYDFSVKVKDIDGNYTFFHGEVQVD